ncbi:porphobilinogen synthase [Porphyromonas cangingivalis]|uniref:Delta-aminolevulinic acid dehydratase n=1 Tax=Porphyromonas cangingivalis TaxID=36874 RepID=A0A099X0F4_PORCN|nr:porphobilinogen synthase [Porphyromonas cangingivalis]KGL49930.1 delta-aminolevulinic acid dehydratase [Porphyromonas cangingivalis]KGN79286.1 delta-aminolevulinic acid dehydratase [Porphyromonas cangingivalis]SJZ65644.1 porphobilinogen synthase [Porphyromonas cangingivalis]SPY34862.1 Delta-aminolevulinic acid dehydratase [Porphyromonas cangingivalis]VEJ03023.1 Delta-aminolevulinic acid dehydratase [Porphyromonas cangingivalis]
MYPEVRLRRLRSSANMRDLVRETRLHPSDFIHPLFVVHGEGIRKEISSLPGQYHLSVDELVKECRELYDLGVKSVMLFGIPAHKDATGSEALHDTGIVQQGLRALTEALPDMITVADICMCEYTDHGHCGILHGHEVDNDETVKYLVQQSVSMARCGAKMIAPSDMMDGRIAAIRKGLDEAGFSHIPIMSYASKFSSAFYGPFRIAADSAPSFGDRRGYQMDPANGREALREIEQDILEGADIIMVKPALAYLDILHEASQRYDLPMAAYHVSGEYAMIKAAAEKGWIDHDRVMMESLLSIRRAGAKIILTYFAKEAAQYLRNNP